MVLLQLAVGQVPDSQLRHPGEGGPLKLLSDLVSAIVWSHQKQGAVACNRRAQGQIEHAYDARIDGRGVFDFECGGELRGLGINPYDIDQSHRLQTSVQAGGQLREASVS